jgi:peroxiredoxin
VGALPRSDDLHRLPDALPDPADDGACAHLPGLRLPSVSLLSTHGRLVNLATLSGTSVVYIYPRTGRPDVDPPTGWNQIPGARGCTPQSCAFRDHHGALEALGARVFGLSTQTSDYQKEAAERLHLPTFVVDGMTLIKRLTLIVRDGVIAHVFYPVFPPDRNPDDVAAWPRATRKEASHP